MRPLLLGLLCVVGLGCQDLTGSDEETLRLLLYASPRVVPTDGAHVSLIGVEAVKPGESVPQNAMCARVSVQLGSFDSPIGATSLPLNPDGGISTCPSARCVFVALPTGGIRRDFVVYRSSAISGADILLGELYELPAAAGCPPATALPAPSTSTFLTLQVPDSPLPTADFATPEPADLSAAVDMRASDL